MGEWAARELRAHNEQLSYLNIHYVVIKIDFQQDEHDHHSYYGLWCGVNGTKIVVFVGAAFVQ